MIEKLEITKNGIAYEDTIGNKYNNYNMHVVAIEKEKYKINTLKRYINRKYEYKVYDDDLPNEFIGWELYNPHNIDVLYYFWSDYDIQLENNDFINEIQKFKYKT